ncbi:hypothetical protein MD484_g4097, partial [Candolleomyces efflorescens]
MSNIEPAPQAAPVTGVTPVAASGQAASSDNDSFEQWIKGFEKYESMLGDVAKISLNPKYKEELGTVEQWYKVLTPSERTATVYHLIQTSTQDQLRFYGSTIQRLAIFDDTPAPSSAPLDGKPKLSKLSMRPPSLNLPSLGSPATPTPLTATKESDIDERAHALNLQDPSTWTNSTNAGNTPLLPLFQKTTEGAADSGSSTAPGLSMMNPYTLNMLANAGLSPEAQLLAVQLIMSGLVQPTGAPANPAQKAIKKGVPGTATWRTPTSARYPASALRTGLRPSALKSAGLKSAGLDSPSVDSPKPEDFKPEMLEDIPGWLRSLRLHKYTTCFEGLTWQELVCLDDAGLEAKGVAALGARRRLQRTFEHARKTMGLEDPSSATPTSTVNTSLPKLPEGIPAVPHSAVPANRSKLSINSPIFTPAWETSSNGPKSAAPSIPSPAAADTTVAEAKPAAVEA